jgi:hypothetical protein
MTSVYLLRHDGGTIDSEASHTSAWRQQIPVISSALAPAQSRQSMENSMLIKLQRTLSSRLGVLLCIAVALCATTGYAQIAGTGNIQGVVTDSTGAVIPNAAVTATSAATQVQHIGKTGSDGLYSFPNLAIGTYSIEVAAPGFQHYRQSNIVLEVGSSIAVNVSIQAGGVTQEVDVKASGLALQTEDTSFKQTIDQKTVTELPLNGRLVTSLITISGGSVNANTGNDLSGSKSFPSSVVISIAGGQGNATDYRLDGGDHNDYMTNINLPFPFPDAVAEFSVETTALGAQSGLHPGGLVNVVTRSGSNQWHGSAFEFIRNNFIDATNFFSTSKDTLHQNQYGGTFGGKIITNKLFFFAGYQRTTADQSQALTKAYVPTPANLAGDFSATDGAACESNGQAVQLLNPLTGAVLPNDQIDPILFDQSALALQKYLPPTTNPCGLVTYAIPSETSENQFVTRVDWILSSKHSAYGRYLYDGYNAPAFYSPTNILITTQAGLDDHVQGLALGETYVASSNFVNSFHATGTIRDISRGSASEGINPATLGINMYSTAPIELQVTASNKWSIYCSTCGAASFNVNTFSYADDISWIRGKHQITFGGEYARTQLNGKNLTTGNGAFTLSGIYGQKGPNGTSPGGTGADANLDFLTGAMSGFVQSSYQENAARMSIPTLYVQDTYHATSRLVVSAGVRWDPEYFPTDYFGRGSAFSMSNFVNDVFSAVFPNAPAGMLFYGDPGVLKSFTTNSLRQFSPRLGITYDPYGMGRTVFRAGSALIYDTPNFFTAEHVNQDPPFSQSIANTPVGVPLSFSSPWSNGSVQKDPFPYPTNLTPSATFAPGNQYYAMVPHFRPPYTMQWTASVQQEFGNGWQFQLDYLGNATRFEPYPVILNPAVYIPGTCGAVPCSTLGNTASRFLLTRLNPTQGPSYQGGGGDTKGSGSVLISSGVNASYNGLVASIQHRLSSNFVFLANYTWSHCIDILDDPGDVGTTVSPQNTYDEEGDKGSCGFDYRHVFNTALVASSHFSSLNGWKALTLNGWEISPLIHATDGAPFTVVSGQDNSLTDQNNDRPNLINGGLLYTRAKLLSGPSANAQYINASAFLQNPIGTFGDSGRNAYRGPKFLQVDSALNRTFALHENLALNLRIDAFNLLNHPNFAPPGSSGNAASSSSLVSSTFGQITSTTTGYGARIFQGAVKLTF